MNFSFFTNFIAISSFLIATNLCALRTMCCDESKESFAHHHEDSQRNVHSHTHDENNGKQSTEHHDRGEVTCCSNFPTASSIGAQTEGSKFITELDLSKVPAIFPQVVTLVSDRLIRNISGVDPPILIFRSLLSTLHRAPNAPPVV